jgi:hypothetical protein
VFRCKAEREMEFTGTITTNGTSVSVHMRLPRPGKPAAPVDEPDDEPSTSTTPPPPKVPKVSKERLNGLVLLVDPGRINLITMTVMYKGKPVSITCNNRAVKLVFKLTARQLYSIAGTRVATVLQRRRRTSVPDLAKLDRELSRFTTRTNDVASIVRYLDNVKLYWEASWKYALSQRSATSKFRCKGGKERGLMRFFSGVKSRLTLLYGAEKVEQAVVVWGAAKVSPSGRGNLPVPTGQAPKVAARFWPVLSGDEYRTSQACSQRKCHKDMHHVRVVCTPVMQLDLMPTKKTSKLGWCLRRSRVQGLHHKRVLRRSKEGKDYKVNRDVRVRTVHKWVYDGHGGESDEEKAKKRAARAAGVEERYLRGLLFCQGCKKPCDRDVMGCDNIGTIWYCTASGQKLPEAFDRTVQLAKRRKKS